MLPVFEFDARGDSSLIAGAVVAAVVAEPLLEMFGDNRAGEGELDRVDDDDDDDDEVAVAVDVDELEEFELDLVEFDGEAREGEVDSARFKLPACFKL